MHNSSLEPQPLHQRFCNRILLHIPHSGTQLPPELEPLRECVLCHPASSLTDHFTDALFSPSAPMEGVDSIVFPYLRSVCDVERLPHDPLEARGCGIISIPEVSAEPLLKKQALRRYESHQRALADELLDAQGQVLLIDCHSFSAQATALCADPGDVDICLGFNSDWSRPSDELIGFVTAFFRAKGYRVGLNTPFSNAKTVECPASYQSLMIEVSKRLYMNEQSIVPSEGFSRLHADLVQLYSRLL